MEKYLLVIMLLSIIILLLCIIVFMLVASDEKSEPAEKEYPVFPADELIEAFKKDLERVTAVIPDKPKEEKKSGSMEPQERNIRQDVDRKEEKNVRKSKSNVVKKTVLPKTPDTGRRAGKRKVKTCDELGLF